MSIFDFVRGLPLYFDKPRNADRLNTRHRFLVEPFMSDIREARVLDLASHDGRWPYAYATAGAREVIGIEGRRELIDEFANYPEGRERDRVRLIHGDINVEVPKLANAGERFDIVCVLGIFYHITTHYELLSQIRKLRPKLIIIDSEFMNTKDKHIKLILEDPSKRMNTLAAFDGQEKTVKGVPTRGAMEMMAANLGYSLEWLDWNRLPGRYRQGVQDYYREGPKTRATCVLRPAH
jgi:hypothetical protein